MRLQTRPTVWIALASFACLLSCDLFSGAALAQSYPTPTIEFIVPTAEAGIPELVASTWSGA